MLEKKVDILSEKLLSKVDAICFTSNGVVKSNGELVMGAGVAKAFKNRWPGLPRQFGCMVRLLGNSVHMIDKQISYTQDIWIVSFPTKNDWRDPSDLNLIIRSCEQLMDLVNGYRWDLVALPRPGCQNGGLDWKKQVKPKIEGILDDRVIVVHQ